MHLKRPSPVRFGKPLNMVLRHRSGGGAGGTTITGSGGALAGTGSPEGVVASAEGSTYLNKTTGDFYVKATGGSTNTGWAMLIQGG